MGNRSLVDGSPYVPNNLNQYSTVGGTTYSYDPNGNLTNDGTNTYTFDAENRLVSASGPSLSATYTYDAFGRRISKTVNGVTTKFTYDGDQIIEELDGAGVQTAEYVYGTGIDEPLRMQRGTTKSYFLADGLSSITHLTDKDGKIVESYTYDPYGKPTILDATGTVIPQSAYGNRFLFTGREYDQETGLQNNRHRDYDSRIGRFLQRDPYTWAPNDPRLFSVQNLKNRFLWASSLIQANDPVDIGKSTLLSFFDLLNRQVLRVGSRTPALHNPYPYVGNNPVNRLDPTGKLATEVVIAIVGGVVILTFVTLFVLGVSPTLKKIEKLKQQQGSCDPEKALEAYEKQKELIEKEGVPKLKLGIAAAGISQATTPEEQALYIYEELLLGSNGGNQ